MSPDAVLRSDVLIRINIFTAKAASLACATPHPHQNPKSTAPTGDFDGALT